MFFSNSIPGNLKMKDFNAAVGGGRVHLKSFLGSKAAQLNDHIKPTLQEYTYDAAIIHVNINDILRCKNDEELRELPNNIMKTSKFDWRPDDISTEKIISAPIWAC